MFALVMSEDRISVQPRRSEIIQGLRDLPDHIQQVLGQDQKVSRLAESLYTKKSLLVMGRGYRSVTSPVIQESDLKYQSQKLSDIGWENWINNDNKKSNEKIAATRRVWKEL